MPSTSNTWKLLGGRVGEQGATAGADVHAGQELLVAAGTNEPNVLGGAWGKHRKNALRAFQRAHHLPERNYVDPSDECLFALAEAAQILVPMPNKLGISGVKILHQWFVDNKIGYQKGAESGGGNRPLYVDDCADYAIQRINMAWRAGPVLMDCTTYVNCMLSVFLHGNVHSSPYSASCAAYGDTSNNHMARERYGLLLVSRPVTTGGVTKKENYFRE